MKKTLTIVGIIVLALAIVSLGVYFFAFSDSIIAASVVVTSGIVQVDTGDGFEQVTGMVHVSKGDLIRTEDGARAAIVIHESIITLLEPNTQIEIVSLSKTTPILKQEMGITFTRFPNMASVRSFDIRLPTSTVTARTAATYRINMDGVRVSGGQVLLKSKDGVSNFAEANNAVVLDVGQWNKRAITSTERAIMRENIFEMVPVIKTIRDNLVFKNKNLLSLAEKEYGITPVMILDILTQADIGKIDANDVSLRIPVKVPVMSRVTLMTRTIAEETQRYYAPV